MQIESPERRNVRRARADDVDEYRIEEEDDVEEEENLEECDELDKEEKKMFKGPRQKKPKPLEPEVKVPKKRGRKPKNRIVEEPQKTDQVISPKPEESPKEKEVEKSDEKEEREQV